MDQENPECICNINEEVAICERQTSTILENNQDVRTICILHELNRIYEDRLQDIDKKADGDCKLKYSTYKEWNEMLMNLIKDLVETVQELEFEACKRIELLERKLNIDYQIKSQNENIDINQPGISKQSIDNPSIESLNSQLLVRNHEIKRLESEHHILKNELSVKELQVQKYEKTIQKLEKTSSENKINVKPIDNNILVNLQKCLEEKEKECLEKTQENDCLKAEIKTLKEQLIEKDKTLINMRALTFELAEKHDQIQQIKTQYNDIEDDLKKALKKIKFKDNVIRELRKDSKNYAKSSIESTFKSSENKVLWSDLLTNQTLETVLEIETSKLKSEDAKENCLIKTLQDELDDLFQNQLKYVENNEEQKNLLISQQEKLKNFINCLFQDLTKTRVILDYIRSKLLFINNKNDENSFENIESDCISQDDIKIDNEILDSIKDRINILQDENKKLKFELEKLQTDMADSNLSKQENVILNDNNEKVLQEVAKSLSNICGEQISLGSTIVPDCDDQVHPLCQAMANLQNDIIKKDDTIKILKETVQGQEEQLEYQNSKLLSLEYDCRSMKNAIFKKDENYNESLCEIQNKNECLENELNALNKMQNSCKCEELLNAKIHLENECQNQSITISNLRKALENFKRNGTNGNSPVVSSNNGNPSSLWGWWRNNNVHDI